MSAYNGVALAYGRTAPSTPPVIRPGGAPEPPSRIEVNPASPSSLAISWSPPNDVMGAKVTSYQVVSKSRPSGFNLAEGCVIGLSIPLHIDDATRALHLPDTSHPDRPE